MGASVAVGLGDVAISDSTRATLLQRFVVSFVKMSDTEPVVRRSGNPGYVVGAPLLGGNCSSSYPHLCMCSHGGHGNLATNSFG